MQPKGILFFHGPLTRERWRTQHHLRQSLRRSGLLEPSAPLMRLSDHGAVRHIPQAMALFRYNLSVLLCDEASPWLAEAQSLLTPPLFCFYKNEPEARPNWARLRLSKK